MTSFEEQIQQQLAALHAQTSLYARHLVSGKEIRIRADEVVNTLSTIKLAIMVLAYREADASQFDLDARYRIAARDRRRGSGLLQLFAPGLEPTWRDLVTQMIVTSDNTATDLLIARLGLDRVNTLLAEQGYTETRLQTTTGALFRRLWEWVDPANASLSDDEVYARGFPADEGSLDRQYRFVADPAEWLGRTTAREMARLLEQIQQGEVASPAATD